MNVEQGKITAVIPVRTFDEGGYLVMATLRGIVKKTALIDYDTSRRDGLIAINLDEDDELIGVHLTDGQREIVLGTRRGMAIRFAEQEVRPMGRNTHGVKGIALPPGDLVVGMDSVRPGADLMAVTENGFGKRTSLDEFRSQGRGGRGIIAIRASQRNGPMTAIMVVEPGDELMIITIEGIIIRINTDDVSRVGRAAQGVTLMRLDDHDRVVAVARVPSRTEDGEE